MYLLIFLTFLLYLELPVQLPNHATTLLWKNINQLVQYHYNKSIISDMQLISTNIFSGLVMIEVKSKIKTIFYCLITRDRFASIDKLMGQNH